MRCLNVTPAAASAELTIAASRISEKGRTFDCGSDLTFSEIHRRVAWGMVGLLAGIGISSCNHQSFTQGGRYLSIPSCAIDLRISECHSCQESISGTLMQESRFSVPDTNGTRKSLKPLAASVCAPACAAP